VSSQLANSNLESVPGYKPSALAEGASKFTFSSFSEEHL
jgi:hypothetical protein